MPQRRPSSDALHRLDAAHFRHSGLRVVQREAYREWEFALEHFVTGLTVRREQFHVRLTNKLDGREEYLRGFASRVAALQAARRRVDFIVEVRDPRTLQQRSRRRRAAG